MVNYALFLLKVSHQDAQEQKREEVIKVIKLYIYDGGVGNFDTLPSQETLYLNPGFRSSHFYKSK
jgi:hypothetical protein